MKLLIFIQDRRQTLNSKNMRLAGMSKNNSQALIFRTKCQRASFENMVQALISSNRRLTHGTIPAM